jgi:hypothetical protein
MQAWARVRAYLPDDSHLELEQAHLRQYTREVAASVGAFLGLDQSEHAVQDYLAENRPEYTGSAPDDGEVLVGDTGWNRAERRACQSICAETASALGVPAKPRCLKAPRPSASSSWRGTPIPVSASA